MRNPRTPGGGITEAAECSRGGDNAVLTKTAPYLQRRFVLALQLDPQAEAGRFLGWHGLIARLARRARALREGGAA
jgi:hypothetical protein